MSRTVIVVSALVDATIREGQPDTTFILKHTLTELAEQVEQTPIRADYLYFTQETIPHVNTSLNFIVQLLENPFLKVDKVCYITEKGAHEVESVKYIVAEKGYTNWEIVEGALTREYVTGVITGSLRTDSFNRKHKALYRVPRNAYIQDRIKNKMVLEEQYEDDERLLKDVPTVEVPEATIIDSDEIAKVIHVVGLYSEERTALTFLLAQYLAQEGKTVIVEKDTEWHMLTEFVTKSDVECFQITAHDIMVDPQAAIEHIKRCKEKLVVITAISREFYSYNFLVNVLYANLAADITYLVREDDFNEMPATSHSIVAVPASIIGILKSTEQLDYIYLDYMRFVAVNLQQLPETRIINSHTVDTILSDVLETDIKGSIVVNLYSLKIGGDGSYDLRSLITE